MSATGKLMKFLVLKEPRDTF